VNASTAAPGSENSGNGNLTEQALYYDYASTANPIFAGLIPPVPYHSFSPDFLSGPPAEFFPWTSAIR